MTKKILHFTLGPVQGFIADARRTRDLWAGSFLLSWLSGKAMVALVEAKGEIVFPEVADDDLFKAIKEGKGTPYVGSLPNRFKANVTNVTGDVSAGKICKDAIDAAWKELTDAVWNQFFKSIASHDHQSKTIWDRQVHAFWDMNWVIGDEEAGDGSWLDQRKNWRTHYPTHAEGGDLCTLMGNLQEISGFDRLKERDKQKVFYDALRQQKYHSNKRSLGSLNISDGERLCSIALVKRFFPLLDKIEAVIGWRPGGGEVNIINWPSVSYIAAVPWLKGVEKHVGVQDRKLYTGCVAKSISDSYKGEMETKLFGFPEKETFFQLDGHLLHQDGILTWDKDGLTGADKELSRKNLLKAHRDLLNAFPKAISKEANTAPSEFYAVLLMDGDQIGAMIGQHAEIIKKGLGYFTQAVKNYFAPKSGNPANGVLIYAGGDDVLALLPLDSAIEAADALRKEYAEAFEQAIKEVPDDKGKPEAENFTLSGAIVFAQYKIPLSAVLKTAHKALDSVAKEQNGRNSLALVVMKPGGVSAQWVTCWLHDPLNVIQHFAQDRADYSASFLYNLRERYSALFPKDNPNKEGEDQDDPQKQVDPQNNEEPSSKEFADFMKSLVKAEYAKGKSRDHLTKVNLDDIIEPIIEIGRPHKRKDGKGSAIPGFTFEGLMVAHFMSNEGRWRLQK